MELRRPEDVPIKNIRGTKLSSKRTNYVLRSVKAKIWGSFELPSPGVLDLFSTATLTDVYRWKDLSNLFPVRFYSRQDLRILDTLNIDSLDQQLDI